jgi:hypothetical protein
VGFSTSTAAVVQSTTLTGTQNDFAALAARHLVLRCNNASLLTLSGFAAGSDGDIIEVISIGGGEVDITHQDTGSAAATRCINFVTSCSTPLAAGSGYAKYVYDATTARWRLVVHEQGAWITPTFSAGAFTGTGSMTWTVDAGDVTTFAYRISGRTMILAFYLLTTTVGGTPSDPLLITIPRGATAAKTILTQGLRVSDNGTLRTGYVSSTAAGTTIALGISANWAASTNNTAVFGSLEFELQ